jgi:hypothetical protein
LNNPNSNEEKPYQENLPNNRQSLPFLDFLPFLSPLQQNISSRKHKTSKLSEEENQSE